MLSYGLIELSLYITKLSTTTILLKKIIVFQGDGGGPLIYQDEIIGLYSFPVRKVSELNVYIKISKYVPYIEKAKKRLTLKNKRINTGKFSFVKQKANNMREKYRKNNERRNSQTA